MNFKFWLKWPAYFVVACGAVAVLIFLYFKNQGFSIERQQNALEYLTSLRQLNIDMDAGVLRSNVGLISDYDPISSTLIDMLNTTSELGHLISSSGQESALFAALQASVNEKAFLADHFKAENAVLKNSLRYLPTVRDEVVIQIAKLQDVDRYAEELISISANTIDIFDSIMRYNVFTDTAVIGVEPPIVDSDVGKEMISWDAEDVIELRIAGLGEFVSEVRRAVLAQIGEIKPSNNMQALLDALSQASTFVVHGKTVLRQKSRVEDRMEHIVSIPLLKQIDLLNKEVELSMSDELKKAEQYRLYLLGYASFLLLFVFYFAARLAMSYRQISVTNKQLQIANETLEQRVQTRTADLEKALEELKLSEIQLVQSEKMASLGQMVAGVAHEINTPLAYVRSTLETIESNIVMGPLHRFVEQAEKLVMLMRGKADDETLNQQFALTIKAFEELGGEGVGLFEEMGSLIKDGVYGADQISDLVLNLRNFSRLDKGRVSVFQIQDGIESTLVLAKNVVKNRKIIKNYGDIPPISCSPSQINQVLLNIINNAVYATEEGSGTITISTLQEESGYITVKIADNGKGINPEHLNRLFDPFFTTKEVGQGTGLGLSIVYKIVKEHYGEIIVDSKVGEGTCFSIKLPVDLHISLELKT